MLREAHRHVPTGGKKKSLTLAGLKADGPASLVLVPHDVFGGSLGSEQELLKMSCKSKWTLLLVGSHLKHSFIHGEQLGNMKAACDYASPLCGKNEVLGSSG